MQLLGQTKADLILSDMAVNLTGIRITDQANMENLIFSVVERLPDLLKPNGHLLIKLFEGSSSNELRKNFKLLFKKILSIKPSASRKDSREFYLLAKQYQG